MRRGCGGVRLEENPMPEIFSHAYDQAEERLEVRFDHPQAGKVIRIYRHFAREMYEAWRQEGFQALTFFLSFMDGHDEELPLYP
jgi:hypothetical protein